MPRVSPGESSLDEAVSVLTRAFADEPLFLYLWPDPAERARRLPGFFRLMARSGADRGLLDVEPGIGVALWRRPGAWRLGRGELAFGLPRLVPAFGTGLLRALRMLRLVERRHPARPHWYLAYLGVVPEGRRLGVASGLLRRRLAFFDREGAAAYLETQRPGHVAFYESFGFRLVGEAALPGGPHSYFLWREPDAGAVPERGG